MFNLSSRCRLEELSGSEENSDCEEVELIQHISLDINGLNKLFNGKRNKIKTDVEGMYDNFCSIDVCILS